MAGILSHLLWERRAWNLASKVVTLTREEETTVRRLEPDVEVVMIPNGIDHKLSISNSLESVSSNTNSIGDNDNSIKEHGHTPWTIYDNNTSILFVCNFAYESECRCALYFSTEIFPIILEQVPHARLFLVGNSPPTVIRRLAFPKDSHIEVTGYVNSLDPFYKASTVIVCPLRIGGGVKVKLLERLYETGKAIITTSVGAQGLNLSDSRALCVSDKKLEFAQIVIKFLIDPEARYQQEKKALRFSKTLPGWDQVIEDM